MADNTTTNWEDFTPGPGDKPLQSAPASTNQADSWGEGDKPAPASIVRKAGDLGLSVAKGVIAVPEAAVGLADIATGGEAGKFLENEGGAFGFRPKQAKEYLSSLQSDDLQSKQREFQQADGIIDKTKAALSNPSLITNAVAESVPLMGAGAVPARAALAVAPKVGALAAGAIGEGVAGAGSAAEQVRQETQDGLLTPKQAGLAAASGAATAAFGMAGGKLAQRLGIGDVDTMLAQGAAKTAGVPSAKSIPRQVVEGAIAEGWLEELPQSVSEQILQNLSLNKPWSEGVEDAAVMGTLAGMAMGGTAAGVSGFNERGDKPADQAPPPAQPPAPTQGTGPTLALPAPDRGVIQVAVDGTARTPAYQAPGYVGDVTDVEAKAPRAAAADFASILDTDNVYSGWSNVQDGSDRATMRDQMDYVGRTYGGKTTPENAAQVAADLSQQFKWFRAASPEQRQAAISALMAPAAPIDPVREQVAAAAEQGGALSGAALTAIDTGVTQAMQPVATEAAPPAPISLEEADARDQAAYEQFFANHDSDPVVSRYFEDDTDIPDFGAASNVSDEEFLRSLGATDEDIQDAIATARQSPIPQSRPAVDAGAQANEPAGPREGAGGNQAAQGKVGFQVGQKWGKPGRGQYTIESVSQGGNLAVADFGDGEKATVSYDAESANGWGPLDAEPQDGRKTAAPSTSAPTTLRDALANIRAQKQEAANAQAAAPQATPAAAPVPGARPAAVEAAGPTADVKAITAKQIPDMTDAELQVAIAHYGPEHKRTAKLQKEVQRRAAQATQGSTNAPQTAQAQQTSAQPAQAGAAPAAAAAPSQAGQAAPAGASTVRALSDGAPTQNPGAQAAPAAGAQTATEGETREQRTQRVAAAGEAWTRMRAVEREALAARAEGLNPIQRKRVPGAAWADLNGAIQRKLADAMDSRAETGADQVAVPTQQAQAATENVAGNSAGQDEKARWLKSVADMNRISKQQFGAYIDGVANGLLSVVGSPNATKQGRALMAAVDEARRAGATSEEIAAAATSKASAAPATAELSLDDLLKQVNDELANQGAVQNARTRAKRDQIRTAIAERDFPAILKAVDGDVGSAEAINQALQFADEEPKAKVIERVLKNRGISTEYRQRWAERLLDGQVDELDAEMQSYEDRAGVERRPNLKNGPSSANTPVAPPAPQPSGTPSAQSRWDVFMPQERLELLRAAGYTDSDQARALSGLKWVELSESVRKAVDAAHKKQVAAAIAEPVAPAPSPGVVNVPPTVDAALAADMDKQKSRVKRLRTAAAADGISLDDKKAAQMKVTAAEATLRAMRTQRFDAEDAAVKALAEKDAAAFGKFADLFPAASDALQALMPANDSAPSPKPAPKKKPSADQTRAKADLMAALADLGDILGKNARMNITPEQEVKLLPVLTRVLDAAFRLGYHKFKDAAKFALDQIRANLGDDAADALTLDHLQGAYIAMAGGKTGADTKRAVIDVESKAEIEAHEAKTDDEVQEDAAAAPDAKTLTESLYQAIGAGNMPKDNPALKKLVETFDGKPADPARMKQAQEELETAIAMSARDIVAKGQNDKATFDELLRLYESQPSLNIRTSTSVANQAYSTPAPLAFIASRLAGITRNTVAHEPTGGTGMLLIGADPKKALVNELNDLRISALKAQGFTPTQLDASTMRLVPEGTRPDAVVTNPPFGSIKDSDGKPVKVKVDGYSIGQIDHLIAARALETMKDDGKAALILGANKVAGGLSTDDRIFFNWLYSHYNVVGHFEVEGDLYARQGAGWPVRVITINGRQKSGKLSPVAGTIQRADNWSQVYEQFTQSLSAAAKPATVEAGGGPAVAIDAPGAPGGRRPQGSTGSAGNVAGTSPRAVPDRAKPAAEPVAPVPDEQRLNAQSFVPQPQPGQGPAGAERPAKPAGTTAVAAAPAAAGNEFQTPYVPRSARKDEGVLIPSNMAQPTQDALNRLEDAVGDIDEFARKELGYESTEALHNALMGLQVDSVATAIYQIKQGKAAVIADQTGIGKGRQAASIIRWAARNGMTPVFVSVKPSLFTDMYGDLADIGTHDVAPFILNSTEWVSGADGEKLFTNKPSTHRAAIQSIVDNAALPQGRNALFMTYSQINTANLQRQALMALAPNAVFVLDESHNAAGDSGTGDFMISVLKEARGVTYLSATYAKRPDNMPLYFKTDIGDAAADSEGLADAMAAGGLPLQTVVSNNLVKAGQMFRRERSYDGVSIASTFDTANRQLHERLSDEATEALRAIVSADKMFHSVFVKSMDKALKAEGSKVQDNAGNQVSAGVQHTEFSSVVHNFVRQMLLGLKAQTAADEAIASLKRGEKPIIAVENTMGSFLSEYAAQNNINQGDSLGAFDYRTVLSRALERSRVINVVLPTGDKSKQNIPLSQLDPMTRKAYDQAQAVIDRLVIDIPVSPIDWMRAEIARAGFSVAEITGRDLAVDYSNPRKPVLSAIDLTEQRDKVASTRRFNGGELDALILNVAGSTGISLHASEKFADQRQRHMIVAQAAGDINIFMQMLGRVHRTGQVRLPKYTILSVDLPTEKRPTAVLSRKMKSLNANTSSNTESATSVKTADILNKYGDQIVNQYLVDNLELARQLGVDDLLSSDGERVSDDIARKATGRLALQPIEVQRAFYEDVEAQYDALIEYLNKTNQNDLEPRTFDFDAKEVRTEILFDGPNKATPFGEDAVYGEYSIKAQGMAMKPEEIQAAIAESLQGKTGAEHARDLLNGLLQTYVEQTNAALAQKVGQGAAFDLDEYAAFLKPLFGEDGAARMMAQAQAFMANGTPVGQLTVRDLSGAQGVEAGMEFLRNHAIGKTFRVEINSEPYNAVITNVRNTHKTTGNPFSLSKFQITLAVNGALRSITVPATQFKKIEVSSIAPAFRIETLFKEQPANQRETAKIVTGNLLAAYGELKGVRGTIISFTKSDGTIEQGILLPKLFDFGKNTQGDYRLRSGADALKFLQKSTNKDIGRFGISTRDGQVRVLPRGDGVQVRVPKSKAQGARYFLDKNLIAVAGDFVSSANAMVANVEDAASAEKVLDMLMDKQALYALPSMADEAKSMAAKPGADGSAASFSRSEAPAAFQGLAPEPTKLSNARLVATQMLVDEIKAKWTRSPEIIVARNMQDMQIPQLVRDYDAQLKSQGSDGEARGFIYKGKVYLLADQLNGPAQIAEVLFHEVLGHYGLRGAFGDGLTPVLQQIGTMRRAQVLAKAREYGMVQKGLSDSDTWAAMSARDRLSAAEEVLAEMAQTTPEIGFVQRAIAAIRTWLRANVPGFKALALTDDEIVRSYILPARGYVARSDETPQQSLQRAMLAFDRDGQDDAPMFSRSGMASMKASALDQIHQTLTHPGKVSLWDKTVGTMRHLAERAPAFKPVFESAQRFIDDVSTLANEAADAAPRLLPRVETLGDLKKKPITAADNKAIARPLFEGTLMWGRDVDGKAVLVDDLSKKYANMPAAKKAQMLLATGRIQEGTLKMWQGLPLAQYETLVNSRFENQMLKAGVVWTDAELKDLFNATPEQISLYREARQAIDRSIDLTARADMLRSMGADYAAMRDAIMEAPTLNDAMLLATEALQADARENPDSADRLMAANNQVVKRYEDATGLQEKGYAPLSRFGRYTVDVVDAAGERQYFGMFESMREANQMAAKMRSVFPGAAVTSGTMSQEAYKLFAGITPETLEQFGNMLGLQSEGNEAQDKAFQEYIKLAKNNHSALKRLIHRQGIDGYSEDVGRVLASFVYSNARQAAGGLNAGTMENAINAIPKEQGELKDVAMGLQDYIANPQEEGQAVRGMLFAQYLGGSVASAFVNMTQPFAVTMPYLSQFGGMRKASAQLARAVKDVGAKEFKGEPDLTEALRRAVDDGTVAPQEIHQLMAQARGTGSLRVGDGTKLGDARAAVSNNWERVKVAWGQPFALAEQFNRRSTFIAAYRMAKEQGQANPGDFARKAVLETQFLYSKANKARWARGAVGGTLMTFKTYSVSYLELLQRTWNAGAPGSPERAAGRRAVAWAVVMLMLMGGAGGLPFAEDAEDLIDGIGQLMGYNVSAKQWRKELLRDTLGKELGEFVNNGVSGLPGAPVDVSGRLGMGNLIPGTGLFLNKPNRERDLLEVAGPAGDLVARGFTGARKLLTGDVAGAALELSPSAVRNAAKGIDMAASGIYKDSKGYKVLDTTLTEAAAKFVGFQPRSVAEVQEANAYMLRSKGFYTQTSSEIKAQWAKAIFDKDERALEQVRERLQAWNRNNPDQKIVVKMPDVLKRVREMGKDRTQRIADTSPKALRQQMREEAANVKAGIS